MQLISEIALIVLEKMFFRWIKLLVALMFSLIVTLSIMKLMISIWTHINFGASERLDVDLWLEQNHLDQYKETFRKRGKSHFTLDQFCVAFRMKFEKLVFARVLCG